MRKRTGDTADTRFFPLPANYVLLFQSGAGVRATIIRDGMTRAPLVRFSSAKRASEVKFWLEDKDNFDLVAETFDSTSR